MSKKMVILRFFKKDFCVLCDKEKQIRKSSKQAQCLRHGPTATVY